MPTLNVTARDFGDAVDIRVRGNGTGILADIRDKLFQPFFTTKPTGEGTALACRSPTISSRSSMAAASLGKARSANTASLGYGCHATRKRL